MQLLFILQTKQAWNQQENEVPVLYPTITIFFRGHPAEFYLCWLRLLRYHHGLKIYRNQLGPRQHFLHSPSDLQLFVLLLITEKVKEDR